MTTGMKQDKARQVWPTRDHNIYKFLTTELTYNNVICHSVVSAIPPVCCQRAIWVRNLYDVINLRQGPLHLLHSAT